MHRYIVCIGSNYNRKENLTFARQKLTESFSSICFAPELETEPLFFKNPALFSNQVVMFFSDKDEEVVRKMLFIEVNSLFTIIMHKLKWYISTKII